jgi:hypothetical protein
MGENSFIPSCECPDEPPEKPWTLQHLSNAGDLIDAGPDLDTSHATDLTFVAVCIFYTRFCPVLNLHS